MVNDLINSLYFTYSGNDTANQEARFSQLELQLYGILFEQFDLYPKSDEPLWWELELAYSSVNPVDTNTMKVLSIISQFTRENIDSTKWYPAAAGASFFLLGALRVLRQTPRDKWEWGNALSLIVGGLIYIPLCIMDIGSGQQIETRNPGTFETRLNSAIWRFANSGWVLPSFAILTILVMIADAICRYIPRRSLWRQVGSCDPQVYAPLNDEKKTARPSEVSDQTSDRHLKSPWQAS